MDIAKEIQIAILGAVTREVESLVGFLSNPRVMEFRGQTVWTGIIVGRPILIGTTGLGKVNAAVTTAAVLEHFNIPEVWNTGCAGAYSQGPLSVGDVLISQVSLCGDEGVIAGGEILSTREIGIPVITFGEEQFFDSMPLHRCPGFRRMQEKTPEGWYALHGTSLRAPARPCTPDADAGAFRLVYGPSLTIGMVSGDGSAAEDRFRRYGAFAENMEGSAVVQACYRFGIPVRECRGISNMAGDRSKDNWDIDTAMAHCHGIMMNWLQQA